MSDRGLNPVLGFSLFALCAASSAFAGPLEDAQKKIIELQQDKLQLQQDKLDLLSKFTKVYKGSGICYSDESACDDQRDHLNRDIGLLNNDQISLEADCQIERSPAGSACYGNPYRVRVSLKITP